MKLSLQVVIILSLMLAFAILSGCTATWVIPEHPLHRHREGPRQIYRPKLPKLIARERIIMYGESNTNPNDGSLASFPVAEAEGNKRLKGHWPTTILQNLRLHNVQSL